MNWSEKYSECQNLECITPDSPHNALGLCKSCYGKKWNRENRKRRCELAKKWVEEHPGYYGEYKAQYHRDNAEKINNRSRQYHKDNLDRARAAYKRRMERNPNCIREWRRNNIDKVAIYNHRRRALKLNAEGSYTEVEIIELRNKQNDKCLCCGKEKKLTVDHVVPLSMGGSNSIDNIQLLCNVCNSRKYTMATDYRRANAYSK